MHTGLLQAETELFQFVQTEAERIFLSMDFLQTKSNSINILNTAINKTDNTSNAHL